MKTNTNSGNQKKSVDQIKNKECVMGILDYMVRNFKRQEIRREKEIAYQERVKNFKKKESGDKYANM